MAAGVGLRNDGQERARLRSPIAFRYKRRRNTWTRQREIRKPSLMLVAAPKQRRPKSRGASAVSDAQIGGQPSRLDAGGPGHPLRPATSPADHFPQPQICDTMPFDRRATAIARKPVDLGSSLTKANLGKPKLKILILEYPQEKLHMTKPS